MWQKLIGTSGNFPLGIVRVVLGVVMFAHGAQKALGWFGGYGMAGTLEFFAHLGIPAPFGYLAIAAEFLGGLGLIVGLLSRVAAFGVFCNMLVAVLTVHIGNGFFMNWGGTAKGEGYEYHLLAMAIALAVMIAGAGRPSMDHALSRNP